MLSALPLLSVTSHALSAPALVPQQEGGTLFAQMMSVETMINEGVTTMNLILDDVTSCTATYEEKVRSHRRGTRVLAPALSSP